MLLRNLLILLLKYELYLPNYTVWLTLLPLSNERSVVLATLTLTEIIEITSNYTIFFPVIAKECRLLKHRSENIIYITKKVNQKSFNLVQKLRKLLTPYFPRKLMQSVFTLFARTFFQA